MNRFVSRPRIAEFEKSDPSICHIDMACAWNRVEENWKQVKGKIQERYGIEKDRAKTDIDGWCGRQGWQSRKSRGPVIFPALSL